MSQYENDAAPAVSKAWRFPSTYTVLIAITAVVWLLTWIIPAGIIQVSNQTTAVIAISTV